MKIRGLGRVRRTVRYLRNSFTPTVLILLYHRIVQSFSDPHGLCVTPQHFAEHLEILRKYGRPMQLQQLTQALRVGNLPHRAVVITFDDGYADNLFNAKPLLEHHDVPATVFVTTNYLGHSREFWWDELECLLLQPKALPEQLRLNVNGSLYQWEFEETDHRSDRRYHYYPRATVGAARREHIYHDLCKVLRMLSEEQRQRAIHEIRAWSGADTRVRLSHHCLLPKEVIRLAEGELVEIGAHTATHPVLSTLPSAAQRSEIQQSQACLSELLGRAVTSFAYPHGLQSDYTTETVSMVRDAGFQCGCAAFAGACRRGSDPFQLPRFMVANVDGEEFARRMKKWFQW